MGSIKKCTIYAKNKTILARKFYQKTSDGWKQESKPKRCLFGWKMTIKKEYQNG